MDTKERQMCQERDKVVLRILGGKVPGRSYVLVGAWAVAAPPHRLGVHSVFGPNDQ